MAVSAGLVPAKTAGLLPVPGGSSFVFEFANGLLLALFAAAAVDVVLGVRAAPAGPGRLGQAFSALWRRDHYLFGGWSAGWRSALGGWLFAAGLVCYEISVTFCNSMARENWAWVDGLLSPVLDWAAFLCFGAKILLGTRYTWRSLGVAGCLYFIARWTYFNSQNIWWIGITVAVMAAKDQPLGRPLRSFLISGLLSVCLVAGLHFAGIVAPDMVSERGGLLRGTYGYGHPNTFGGLVFGLVLAYALLRAKRVRWGDAAILAAVGVFLMVGPASRTAALCTLLLAALLALCRLRRGHPLPRFTRWGMPALVPLLAAVSYLLPLRLVKIGPWNSDFGPAWLARLDALLTYRLSLTWTAYRHYDVKIAGQVLNDWPPLDNSFAFSLYQFGPVVALLLALLLMAALWGMARQNRRVELFCLLTMLVYAFMEMQSFHLTTNPAALLLCGAVYCLPPDRWPGLEPADP